MRSSLWWSLFARGASSISGVVVYPIPLRPFAALGILFLQFRSLPLLPTLLVLLAPVDAHFQFFPFVSVFLWLLTASLSSPSLVLILSGSHWAFTDSLQHHHSVIPQQVYFRRDQQSHVCLSSVSPDSILIEPWMYVISGWWDTLHIREIGIYQTKCK